MIVYDYYAAIGVVIACVSSFVIVYVFTPFLIQWLKNKKLTVPNAHASGNVMVSHPGGPVIMSGIAAGCLVLYAFSQQDWIIAVLMTTIIAFVAGLVDDLKRMGGCLNRLPIADLLPYLLLHWAIQSIHSAVWLCSIYPLTIAHHTAKCSCQLSNKAPDLRITL